MNFQTLEVELEDGRVHPSGLETLPSRARALLTILGPPTGEPLAGAGPSIADLGRDFAGIGNGTHTDLSTNKRHLDDLGK
jgi:hypothetical protein